MRKYIIIISILTFTVLSCKKSSENEHVSHDQEYSVTLKYAKGFAVKESNSHKVIEIFNPWPNSNNSFKHTFSKNDLPVNSMVVTSTTHIPALELLGVENTLVGFPGTDYISSKKTRNLIEAEQIRELGKNESMNTEVLLDLKPDVIIGFGVDGTNKVFETIEKSGIPVIYNGDWTEDSPLAKAEWIKLFGVLFNKEKEADSIFNKIETDYLEAKLLAKNVNHKPTVLSGAMSKDVWYLPTGSSPEAKLLKDANVDYLWQESSGSGSLALSFESVFENAKNAEIWLSPSYYASYTDLENANQHYAHFDAFKNRSIYTFSNTKVETGGVLYYELGIARPDLVLKDIIKICHPDLLSDYQPYFFKPLE